MTSLWLAQALPWVAVAAAVACLPACLIACARRTSLLTRPVLVAAVVLCWLPTLYVALVWAGLLPDRYVRMERPATAVVALVAGAFAAWRLAHLSPRQSQWRRTGVEALAMAAVWMAAIAITGPELGKPLDRLTIVVAIDRSRSIDLVPGAQQRITTDLRIAENGMREGDRIGTVVFGATAATEDPPRPKSDLPAPQRLELGRDGTDIGAAIRRALAEVPSDSAARIVLMSDGVANRGDALAAAAAAVAAGVPVDTVVLDQKQVPDVRVVAVRMPSRAHEGETLELRVVTASSEPTDVELRLKRDGELIGKTTARIEAGEDVLRIREKPPGAGLHRYDVEITALRPEVDQAAEDNAASAFVRVKGPSTALVLEGDAGKGAFLAQALEQAGFRTSTGSMSAVPADIGGFARYDVVLFSDIPAYALSPTQIEAMAAYVRDLGGGLVLFGGDRSLGPGGYAQTAIEDVSPVSFDIKQDRRRASLAEVILIDYSGSMAMHAGSNTKLELANEASARAAALLGAGDQLGVAHVDTAVSWSVPLAPVTDKQAVEKAIRSVKPGGGGIYVDLALEAGYAQLDKVSVNLKHVLLFADGSDAEQMTRARTLVSGAKRRGITTSVVALGKGSDVAELETLSRLGDGRFYLIEDARRLPVVFTQETILAARSSINEVDFRVALGAAGPATRGIDFASAPILRGYVVTLPKDRASVLLTGPEADPLLATWSVGMGRAAAFTSDVKDRWGVHWTSWPGASSMVAQLARDVSRLADDPRVRLQADTAGGQLHVRAEVVGDDGRAQTFRRLTAHVAGPDGVAHQVPLEPVGAGSYSAVLALSRPGTYVVTARDELANENVGTTAAALSAGEELRPTGSDRALLNRIAAMTGGKTRDTLAGVFLDRSSVRFAYRSISGWLVALAAMCLLTGVAARRLSTPDTWRTLPSRLRARLRWSRASAEQAAPATTATWGRLGHVKERSKAVSEPQAPPPPAVAVAKRPARPTPPVQVSSASPTAASERASQPPTRTLTAAEILLQKRRGRRT